MVHSFNFFFSCVMTKIWWKIAVHIVLHHSANCQSFQFQCWNNTWNVITTAVSVLWNIIVSAIFFVLFQLQYNIKNSDTWVRSHYWTIRRHTNGYTCNQVSFFACCTCLTWYSLVAAFTLATPCLPLNWKKVCYILQSLTKLLNKKLNFSIWCAIIIMIFFLYIFLIT